MKFTPSWRFWVNVGMCLFNLGMFIATKSTFVFVVAIVCCACALFVWKMDKLVFDYEQKQLNKSFDKQKKEEKKDV